MSGLNYSPLKYNPHIITQYETKVGYIQLSIISEQKHPYQGTIICEMKKNTCIYGESLKYHADLYQEPIDLLNIPSISHTFMKCP
jgi:hypothetical protein